MSSPKKTLTFDERNLGGKIQIRQRLLNHHSALLNAKPSLNTRELPPKHVDAKLDPQQKLAKNKKACPALDEVYVGFQKVASLKKGYVDHAQPETFKLMNNKFAKNKKHTDFINQEHFLHLQAQQKRINSIGKSMQERKKNIFDPIAYPSMFFRKTDSENKDINLDFMFSTVTGAKKIATPAKLTGYKDKVTRRPLSAQLSRTNNNNNSNANATGLNGNPLEKSPSNILGMSSRSKKNKTIDELDCPAFTINSDNDYKLVKKTMIDMLIEYRIYKDDDLKLFLFKIKEKNPHLDQMKLDQIYSTILTELEK